MTAPRFFPVSGLVAALVILICDQVGKWAVLERIFRPRLPDGGGTAMGFADWLTQPPARIPPLSIDITSFFSLSMVWNEGVSFGLLRGGGPVLLTALSLGISVWFALWMLRSRNRGQCLALGAVIGGALGNVVDRLRFGAVADFLDFHVAGWHYPAFNVADSAITLGVLALIVQSLLTERRAGQERIAS